MRGRYAYLSITITGLVALAALAGTGCSSLDECSLKGADGQSLCATSAGGSGSTGGGGASGSGGEGGTSPGCDPTSSNKPVGSSCGIFVSSSKGKDTNAGSQAAPVKTMEHALALAKGKPVYACGEAFDQALTISSGATIFGALDCKNGWAYDASKPTVVAPIAAGPALIVAGATDAVEIEDFAFTAKDGTKPGESSIGAFVHDATKVSLGRVDIEAGAGVAGANGDVAMYTFPTQADLDGHDAQTINGGQTKVCPCPGSVTSTGGNAGSATPSGDDGNPGLPDLGGGQGGTPGGDCSSGAGRAGHAATVAKSAGGASVLGKLTAAGWEPAAGKDADDGGPGQGGGGGASLDLTGGGGGGGCGGCGGAGAKGAKGGGASIALLVFNASVALDGGRLTAKGAGDGGKGLAGQPAQTISGFKGNGVGNGCQGGSGGLGADGGASGGGAGGVSAAIFYKGARPKVSKTSSAHGAAGKKGTGGDAGHNDGVAGHSGNLVEAP